ncbi:MAG: HD domain-containing protein [Acidobacteriota bacterium]|nr:MAG: HD domain-containing protein [Acidobacteriota bacterium]
MTEKAKRLLPKPSFLLMRFRLHALVLSLVPILVLTYLVTRLDWEGQHIIVTRIQMLTLTACVVIAALLSFIRIHTLLAKFVKLTRKIRGTQLDEIDDKALVEWVTEPGEIGELARSVSEAYSALCETQKQLEKAHGAVNNPLSSVSKAINFCTNFETLTSLTLEKVMDGVQAKGGAIFSYGEQGDGQFRLISSVPQGVLEDREVHSSLDSYLKWMVKEQRLLVLPALEQSQVSRVFSPPLVFAPFLAGGKLLGAICISGNHAERNFSEEEIRLFSKVSVQLAAAFQSFQTAGKHDRTFFEALCALAMATELRVPHLRGHSERVANYAVGVARQLCLDERTTRVIWDASRLHDIGKMGIDPATLEKANSRESGDWDVVSQHPRIAEQMIRPLGTVNDVLDPVRHHHEFLDGSGFPDGIKAGAISQPTRILTVANIYDGLTTDRPDRSAMIGKDAVKLMRQMAKAGKVDAQVVEALAKNVSAPAEQNQVRLKLAN